MQSSAMVLGIVRQKEIGNSMSEYPADIVFINKPH